MSKTETKKLIEFLDKINTPLYSIPAQKMLLRIKQILEQQAQPDEELVEEILAIEPIHIGFSTASGISLEDATNEARVKILTLLQARKSVGTEEELGYLGALIGRLEKDTKPKGYDIWGSMAHSLLKSIRKKLSPESK